MHVLIIGGTRFIGPHVVRQLVGSGHRVTVFHRGQTEADLPPVVTHIHGDRNDLSSFQDRFRELAPDVVLDMAAFKEQDAADLLQTVRGITRRVVTLSSGDVYRNYGRLRKLESGDPDPVPLAEDAPLREVLYFDRESAAGPEDFAYTYDKIPIERHVMSDPELPGTILRLPAVYGPGSRRTFEYLKRMDDGRRSILLEERYARWRWTRGYVENVARAIVLAVTDERATGHIYNVGEEDGVDEAAWVRRIGTAAGWKGDVVTMPAELLPGYLVEDLNWDSYLVTDTSRLRHELGYVEPVALDEAMARTIAWERTNPPEKIDPAQFDYPAEDSSLDKFRQRHN